MIEKAEDKSTKYYLHDNVQDRYQLKNITEENPEVVKELTAKLEKLLRKNNDPWVENFVG